VAKPESDYFLPADHISLTTVAGHPENEVAVVQALPSWYDETEAWEQMLMAGLGHVRAPITRDPWLQGLFVPYERGAIPQDADMLLASCVSTVTTTSCMVMNGTLS
jgi:hypothetical protein